MKKRFSAFVSVLCSLFVLMTAGCQSSTPAPTASQDDAPASSASQNDTSSASVSQGSAPSVSVSLWAPPIEGLSWGMSAEEAIGALGSDISYESKNMDDLVQLEISGSFPTGYGVTVHDPVLQFFSDDSGITGYDGLVNVFARCPAENLEMLQTNLNESYAEYRKADDFTDPTRWESDSMADLSNAGELEEKLRSALTEALGTDAGIETVLTPSMGAPSVSYSLTMEGDNAGVLTATGKYQVLKEAIQS